MERVVIFRASGMYEIFIYFLAVKEIQMPSSLAKVAE